MGGLQSFYYCFVSLFDWFVLFCFVLFVGIKGNDNFIFVVVIIWFSEPGSHFVSLAALELAA